MTTTNQRCGRAFTLRFPLEPLTRATQTTTRRQLAQVVGVTPRTIHRWAAAGIPLYAADRAAIAAGTHPLLIWPDDWAAASRPPVNGTETA